MFFEALQDGSARLAQITNLKGKERRRKDF
jgi:hypothetical protein